MLLSTLNQQQREALFHLSHNVVVSDGDLATGEQLLMEEMRREMNLGTEFESHYLETQGIEEVFDTRRSRVIVLISLIKLGYADGAFEIEEQSFLQVLCDQFGINEKEFVRIENWVRRLLALEKEASDFM